MNAETFDAIIIGTGQSGPSLAARMGSEGHRVAIVERAKVGGTCVNNGCIPTKTLVASARVAHMARRSSEFGVDVGGDVRVDMKRVHARMIEISGQSNRAVEQWLEQTPNVTLVRGHARFAGRDRVTVGDRTLRADRIFVNVGARPFVPPIAGLGEVDYLTNLGMMDVDYLPEHLIVIGGSYIGLEFGQMYRRFGSQVTVVQRGPRLIARDDPDVSEAVRAVLEAEGIDVRTDTECTAVERRGDGVAVRLSCQDAPDVVEGSHLLLAVGRVPNTDDLDVTQAGLATDRRGFLVVDEQLRTNVPGIWAIGDCNGHGAFTHTSYNDYEIVAANLFGGRPRKHTDRILCYGLFTDPPLGRVGMTESEARASGRRVLVGKRRMAHVGRAKERSETDGFIKILVDGETKQILGAAILGIEGDEAVHCLLTAMYAKAPHTVISEAVHIHPTVSELLPTVLQNLKPME